MQHQLASNHLVAVKSDLPITRSSDRIQMTHLRTRDTF